MKKTIILFDLDGTVIDSTDAIVLSFYDTFDIFALKRPKKEEILKFVGHTLEDMFIYLGVDKNFVDECVFEYKKSYRKRSLLMTTLLPNAKKSIEFAYSFARLGVVTTKTGKYSKDILEHLDVMKYFDVLIGREDISNPKPHKEPIEKALLQMSAGKSNAWMIGDTKLDLISAKNANIKSVGLLNGYGKQEELIKYSDNIEDDSLRAVKYIFQNCIK